MPKTIKVHNVGPVELVVKQVAPYYGDDYRITWREHGKLIKTRDYHTDSKDDALTTAEHMVLELKKQYEQLPIEFTLPAGDGEYVVERGELRLDQYDVVLLNGDRIRYTLTTVYHDMTLKLDVRYNGLAWSTVKITDWNRPAVIKFWQSLSDREFKDRNIRVGNIRLAAERHFKHLEAEKRHYDSKEVDDG